VESDAYPREWEADVLLRDGHPVHVRPITPSDGEALRAFHSGLTERTVYLRFFAPKPDLSDADIAYFTGVDHDRRVALLALDHGSIVGVGRYDCVGDGTAEVAFLVDDAVQGLGLGSILLEHLAAAARERGVRTFVAEVLPENVRMLGAFRQSGYLLEQRREDDVIVVTFDIEPTRQSVEVSRARELRADARSIGRLMAPHRLVVVGTPDSVRTRMLLANVGTSFSGECVVVDGVAGLARTPADVVVAAGAIADPIALIEAVVLSGAHALVVVAGGFDDDGGERQLELLSHARAAGIRVVGPHALGIVNTDPSVQLNASLASVSPGAGGLGVYAQSAVLGDLLLRRCSEKGVGVSSFVGVGNRGDVSGNDLLQYWRADPRTCAVLLLLESMGDARKFARVVQATALTTPVVMVRSGGAEAYLPAGHSVGGTQLTGRAVSDLLDDSGVLLVDDAEALIDVGCVVAGRDLPRGPGISVVSNSDAMANSAANAVVAAGGRLGVRRTLPRLAGGSDFAQALSALREDESTGSIVVVYVAAFEGSALAEVVGAVEEADAGSVVVVSPTRGGGDRLLHGVPIFADVEPAVEALAAAWSLQEWRNARADDQSAVDAVPEDSTAEAEPGAYSGADAVRLIASACGQQMLLDQDAVGAIGCRIRLVHDPMFGPVVSVGLDDPVAELLDDRAYRLAPVTSASAHRMLEGLGSASALERAGQSLPALASIVSRVSRLYLHMDAAVGFDLRAVRISSRGDATTAAAELEVEADVDSGSALVRRMRRVE
jgi:succinyl-CoA synthetase alpha subunit/GNAT superfamily N-acetyltransferase